MFAIGSCFFTLQFMSESKWQWIFRRSRSKQPILHNLDAWFCEEMNRIWASTDFSWRDRSRRRTYFLFPVISFEMTLIKLCASQFLNISTLITQLHSCSRSVALVSIFTHVHIFRNLALSIVVDYKSEYKSLPSLQYFALSYPSGSLYRLENLRFRSGSRCKTSSAVRRSV